MKLWYLASVYMHIICAALWAGGMLFLVLVLLPSIKNHPERRNLLSSVGIKFRLTGWIALILLLLTGLFNMHYRGVELSQLTANSYRLLFLLKLSIFTLVTAISAFHDFYIGPKSIKKMAEPKADPNKTKRYVKTARVVGQLNLLMALIAIALGVLIVRGW